LGYNTFGRQIFIFLTHNFLKLRIGPKFVNVIIFSVFASYNDFTWYYLL